MMTQYIFYMVTKKYAIRKDKQIPLKINSNGQIEKLVSWNYLDQSRFHLIVIFNVLYAIFASKMNSYKISVIVLSQNANT